MEVWYGAEQVPASLSAPGGPGTVVTMGIFDGVHRGHQAVLGRVVELSHELARDGERPLAVAVTFDPHPRSVHQPEADLPLIASLTDRLASLGDLGLDAVLVITYTLDFAAQSPQDFVRTWLEELLGARAVVVGDDVRFGWHNSGDAATLEQIGRQDGFEVEIVSTIRSDEGRRWSSTWIRQCLKDGNMRQVSRVLGRPHRLRGVVVRGLRRGRELGFPTANLEAATAGVVPPDGVYAGWLIRGCADEGDVQRLPAAISIGTNPTFLAVEIEAHVLGRADLNLYGEEVGVELVERLRPMLAFDGLDALLVQMRADIEDTARILDVPVPEPIRPEDVTAQ